MNRIFVLKDVAYAAKVGGGVIAGAKEVNLLSPGALAFFTPQGTLLTLANAAATVPDLKEVMVASGRENDNQLIGQVPRKLNEINRVNYRAFVKPVLTIGPLSIAAADVGEASIRVSDISYTSRYNTRLLTASFYKKASTTITETVDALLAKLNKTDSYVTATKVDLVGQYEVSTIKVTAAATAAGTATVDLNGVTINLPLTITTIAANTAEITAVIDALPGYTATDDGVDTVTIVATTHGVETDIATYAAGGATTSAATLTTTVQGVADTGVSYSIVITPNDDGVSISAAVSGLVEGDAMSSSTPVYGMGDGVDVLQMEKDFSVEEGNGNFIDYTAEWYKRNMEAIAASNYDLITMLWEGTHSSPTRSHNVMKNRAVVSCINGAGNGQSATQVLAIMALIFGNVFSTTAGAEISTDSGTAHDGVAGN